MDCEATDRGNCTNSLENRGGCEVKKGYGSIRKGKRLKGGLVRPEMGESQ